jgi:hypothetical protein
MARSGSWRRRLAIAVVGWPPIGYAVASLLTTAAGCSADAACPAPFAWLPVLAQPLVIGALFLVPPAAAAAGFASLAALAVALPVTAILSVGTVPESRVGAPILGALAMIGYLVALVGGIASVWRPQPSDERPPPDRSP